MSLMNTERDLQFILFEQLKVQTTHTSSDLNQEKLQQWFENKAKIFNPSSLEVATDLYLLSIQSAKEKTIKDRALFQFPETRRILATMKSYLEGSRALLHKINFFSYFLQQEQTVENEQENSFRELMSFFSPVFDYFCQEKILEVAGLAKKLFADTVSIEKIISSIQLREEKKRSFLSFDFIHQQITFQEGKNFQTFCDLLQRFINENKDHPTLKEEILSLKKSLDLAKESAAIISERVLKKEEEDFSLFSTPLLEMVGHLVFGWLLLEQALIALPKLEAIWEKENATVEEPKFAICENNPEARFYEAKVKTARFYIWNLLPLTQAKSQAILSKDRSAMKIRFY